MLTRLDLHLFKCFEHLDLPLAPLTLLTGPNASGKSSIMQSLVLLHQTIREHEWSMRLALNGDVIRLGKAPDVVNEVLGRDRFSMGLADGDEYVRWTFVGDRLEMSMAVAGLRINGEVVDPIGQLRHLLPVRWPVLEPLAERLRGLTYLAASRAAPQDAYPLADPHFAKVVGAQGEHAASVLYWGQTQAVAERLALSQTPPTLLRQVGARMRTLFPGFRLELREIRRTSAVALGLRTADDTEFHRPAHTGFGLTQCFPIVVAALAAADHDILLIENPELHLHPAGQALMGRFLADVAAAGRQVVLETHSDHVLNGVRRSVKDGRLGAEEVAVHFFQPRSEDRPQVLSPGLDDDGRIDFWPPGFFDQFDRDANYFAGWSEGGD